jgi:hypothetical protein
LSSPAASNSGLIDIRGLSADIDKAKKGDAKESDVDDIMNLSGGGAFGTALAAPVLGLSASDSSSRSVAPAGESKSGKSLAPAILGGSALIAAAIVAAVVLMRPPPVQPIALPTATMTGAFTAPAGSVAAPEPTTTNGTNVPPAPGTGTASAKVASLTPSDKNARTGVASTTASAAATEAKPEETAPPATATAPAPAPTPEKPADFASALATAAGKADEKPAENAAASGSGAQFDRGAAAGALGGVDYQSCKKPDGPTGPGHVTITFGPDGTVASAIVDQGPFPGTPVGGCIAGKFRGAHVPPFTGAPVKVGKSFTLN